MAHKITKGGKVVEVETAIETWLADGITTDQIPPRIVAGLVLMGLIDKTDEAVKAKLSELKVSPKEAISIPSGCGTCPGSTKKVTPPEPEPEATARSIEPEKPVPKKRAPRKPRAKKATPKK